MRRIFQYAALLLLSGGTVGAERQTIIPTHGHDLWDAAAGFPGGYVYSVSQTDDGYIWIGTSKGLVRYGGWKFLSISEDGSSVGTKVPILSVLADSNDELWATDDHTHLFRYAAGRLAGPMSDNGRHRYLAALLSRTRDGRLLFASELQGVVEYEHGSARLLLDPGMTPRSLTALTQTAEGAFWIGTRETGVFRLTLRPGGSDIQHLAALTSVRVNCLLPIGDSALLIGTDQGLLSLHNGTLAKSSPELGGVEILALANGREGDVWIGSNGRVFKAHARDIDREGKIRTLDGLSVHGTVTALFEDRDGDLWIGRPEVIERYSASEFTTYLTSAGLLCSNCGAIYADQRDRIWFAPLDGGLFLLSKGSIRAVETAGLKDDTVYSVAGSAEDEVWVARKNGGVTRLRVHGDALQANMYTRQDGLAEDSVYSIYRAPDGTVWAGTLTAGLSRFHDDTWHAFNTKDGLPSNTISAITGNTAGEIFAGTPNGLAVLQHNHWVAYTTEQGLPPGAVESLLFDDAGTLWIGTKKGISFLQSGTVHVPLGAPDALYGEILGIAESQGWLWITTRDHVLRVKRTALLNQSFGEGEYREFGVTEGLPSSEGVKRSRTVVADHRGRIWFSLNKGISVLEPSAFARPAFPVTMRIDGMLVDGRAVAAESLAHIPAGRHRLTFRYAGVNVSNPAAVRYRYRLDRVDPAWSETTALREIDYTNIPPGQFRFHVMGRNPDGMWSGQEGTIAFEVDPAYWQTRWFQVGSVLGLLLLAFSLYRLRLRELHRQFDVALDARVNERTRIARELHDTLLQSLHGLMFQFQAARNMLPRRTDEAIHTLDGAIDATEQAIAESRGAIHDLRTDSCRNGDLGESLKATAQELADSEHGNSPAPAFRMIVEGQPKPLSSVLQDEVYRITREILRNSFQHAHADRIEVEIRYDDQALRLRIRDNGKGIDPKILKEGGTSGHWGLQGVRERARQIGAQLDFWSEVGAGTEVQLNIPAAAAYEGPGDGSKHRRSGIRYLLGGKRG
jgi:signal transduction histidine kinase/ligand-binding sensor domain-containing protein